MCGESGGRRNNFFKNHRRGSKNHRRNFVSYINQPIYPQEKPHLNSSRQIRIFPLSKDLRRSFHFRTSVLNRRHSQEHCSLAYVKSFMILPRYSFVLIISSAWRRTAEWACFRNSLSIPLSPLALFSLHLEFPFL